MSCALLVLSFFYTCTFRASCPWHALRLLTGLSDRWLVVSSNPVSEREEGVVALHLSTGPLKTRSGLEPVSRCEPSTYQPISRLHSHGAGDVVLAESESLNKIIVGPVKKPGMLPTHTLRRQINIWTKKNTCFKKCY